MCKHEWEAIGNYSGGSDGAICRKCKATLNYDEVDLRLNATEALSAEDAEQVAKLKEQLDAIEEYGTEEINAAVELRQILAQERVERDALVGLVKRIAKLEAFDFDLNGDEEWFSLPEATRKEIEK